GALSDATLNSPRGICWVAGRGLFVHDLHMVALVTEDAVHFIHHNVYRGGPQCNCLSFDALRDRLVNRSGSPNKMMTEEPDHDISWIASNPTKLPELPLTSTDWRAQQPESSYDVTHRGDEERRTVFSLACDSVGDVI